MKHCKDCDVEQKSKVSFPDVKPGDCVEVIDRGYYIVCKGGWTDSLYIQSLERGTLWSSASLWSTLKPEEVKKVNLCFKEC